MSGEKETGTAAEVAEQLRASMHADRQLITNAQQEAKEDARRIDRRVDALVIELTDLQRNHTALLVQVQSKASELATHRTATESRIKQEARTLAEASLHHGERIAQLMQRVDEIGKSCDHAESQAAKALSLQDDLPTIRSQLRQALGKLSELEYVAKLRPMQNARRLVAKEIRHVASSAERYIKRFADRLESDIPF